MDSKTKLWLLILVGVIVLAVIIYPFLAPSNNQSETDLSTTPSSESGTGSQSAGGEDPYPMDTKDNYPDDSSNSYSLEAVAMHASKDDCWTTVNGKVYDLTSAISSHPGGEGAISSICGIDGSSKFDNKHGENDKAKNWLDKLYIGDLA